MLSKNQIKLIKSLKSKKSRNDHQLFVVEGLKSIQEFLDSHFSMEALYVTEGINNPNAISITPSELKKISHLTQPNDALALFKFTKSAPITFENLIVALDCIQDPGNLGTIIRLCDWFGIEHMLCNIGTVDCYNPKVVQASMGSLARINIQYLDLAEFLKEVEVDIFGTTLGGKSIYESNLPHTGILIMGNEANGISSGVLECVNHQLTIPRFNKNDKVESLNVAMATSICLNEFRRNFIET